MASFLTILLMVRYMGTPEYAAYTALTGVVMLGTSVSSLGLERAVARYVPDGVVNNRPGQVASFIYKITLYRAAAAIVFALAITLLWQPLTSLFGMQQDANISPAMIALAVVGGSIFQMQSSVFQSLMRQQLLSRVMVTQWGSRFLLTLFFIYDGGNISLPQAMMILAVPEVIGAVVAQVAMSAAVKSHVGASSISQHDHAPWPDRKGLIGVSGYNYLFNLLAIPPQGAIMRLVIAALCPPQFVAAYGFFQSLVEKARQYLPTQLLYMLIEPLLIAKYMEHGNVEVLRQRTQFLYVMNLLMLMPALALVAGCGESLTAVLTGGRYTEYWWLLIPALIQLVLSSQIVLQKIVLTALDKTLRLVPAALLGLLFYGIALFLAISQEAYNLLPFTPLAYFVVVIGYLSLYLRKSNCDVAISPVLWLKILLLGIFVAAAAHFAHVFTASALMITLSAAVAALAIFAVGSFTLGIVTRQDLAHLHNKRNNRLKTNERTTG
jgi:O-antigen/teichoic acid export membrane protein